MQALLNEAESMQRSFGGDGSRALLQKAIWFVKRVPTTLGAEHPKVSGVGHLCEKQTMAFAVSHNGLERLRD